MGRGVRIFNSYWLKMTGKDPNDESKEYWNELQLEPLKKDRMKEFSIREGYWAISRNGILVLSRGGQNIARKTKRRERDVRKKRRAKEA